MAIRDIAAHTGRGLVVAAALLGAVAATTPTPAQAGISDGAAVGLGLGSFALGTALGASARPYYGGYASPYYGGYAAPSYGYAAPAPTYYAPAPAYSYTYPSNYYYGSSYGPYYGTRWGY
jgi:hypothetical protein